MKSKLKIVGISLLVILISLIAFVGIYLKKSNVWENQIPEFKFGMELDGVRELRYIVDTTEEEKNVYIDAEGNILGEVKEKDEEKSDNGQEISLDAPAEETKTEEVAVPETEKVNYATEIRKIKKNEDADVNIENFEKTKSMIQTRIEENKNFEYNIRQDNMTGELVIEVPNRDEDVNYVRSAVETFGKFEVIDEQTGIILLNNSHVKKYSAMVNNTSGYQSYLVIEFTKEGAEKLKEIREQHIETVIEDGESTKKYVSVLIDGNAISTTYFGEEMPGGVLQIPIGQASTDFNTHSQVFEQLSHTVSALQTGKLPIVYALNTDDYIQSAITEDLINICKIAFAVVIALISIYFIIRYKAKGLLGAILAIGYIGAYVIIIKYTNVVITINSIIAFLGMIVINYIFVGSYISKLNNKENPVESFNKTMKKVYLNIIPIVIIAIIFTFVGNVIINTIGMMLFWGILLQALYNAIFTRTIYVSK